MSNTLEAPDNEKLSALVEELEEHCRNLTLECAELRASAAGTDAFARVASAARMLEEAQRDLDRLRQQIAD